jgi:hypothetical protein
MGPSVTVGGETSELEPVEEAVSDDSSDAGMTISVAVSGTDNVDD